MSLPDRRWYVAWHPERPVGVLRAKDAAGLEEWRRRRWRAFLEPPIIVDVTHAVGSVLALVAFPCGKPQGYVPMMVRVVLVLTDAGPDLALRLPDADPLPGEVAELGRDVREAIGDIAGGAEFVLGDRRPPWPRRHLDASFQALAPFPAGTPVAHVVIVSEDGNTIDYGWVAATDYPDAPPPDGWVRDPRFPPASFWPPALAEEDATEPGQLVRVRQTVEQRTEGS